jgi:hypothetical protein
MKHLLVITIGLVLSGTATAQKAASTRSDLDALLEAFEMILGASDSFPDWSGSAACGMLVQSADAGPVVAFAYGGSEAAAAGIKAGDKLVRIDGEYVLFDDDTAIARQLSIPARVNVQLTVVRADRDTHLFTLPRGAQPMPAALWPARSNGKWGYIDAGGAMFIPPVYGDAREFSDDLALVDLGHDYAYINRLGQIAFIDTFYGHFEFHEGRVQVERGGLWSWLNRAGRFIADPRYRRTSPFAEGHGSFWQRGAYGFCNRAGREVVAAQFEDSRSFAQGRAAVKLGGKWGYCDTTGIVAIDPEYDWAGDFACGMAVVQQRSKCGLIDLQGMPRTGRDLDWEVGEGDGPKFSEYLVAAKQGTGYRYFDITGNPAFNARFADARSFHEERAAVSDGKRWGYIDRFGKYVVKPSFDKAGDFRQGLARVEVSGKMRYISRSGITVWQEK